MMGIILVKIYSSYIKSSSFADFFEELNKSSSKLFTSPQSSQYCHLVWCTHLAKILNCKKLYFVTIILKNFNVFKCHVPTFYFQNQL